MRYSINSLLFEFIIELWDVFLLLFFPIFITLLFLLILLFFFLLLFLLFLLPLWPTVVFYKEIVVSLSLDFEVDVLILEKVVEVLNVFRHKSLDDFELTFFLNRYAYGLLCAIIRALVIDIHLVETFLECPFHKL